MRAPSSAWRSLLRVELYGKTAHFRGLSWIFSGIFSGWNRRSNQTGGGCSLARTRLRMHFPANRENNSESRRLPLNAGSPSLRQPAEITGLMWLFKIINPKQNRELIPRDQVIEVPFAGNRKAMVATIREQPTHRRCCNPRLYKPRICILDGPPRVRSVRGPQAEPLRLRRENGLNQTSNPLST